MNKKKTIVVVEAAIVELATTSKDGTDWKNELAGGLQPGVKCQNEVLAQTYGDEANFVFSVLGFLNQLQDTPPLRLTLWFMSGTSQKHIRLMQDLWDAVIAGGEVNVDAFLDESFTQQEQEAIAARVRGLTDAIQLLLAADQADRMVLAKLAKEEYRRLKTAEDEALRAVVEAIED